MSAVTLYGGGRPNTSGQNLHDTAPIPIPQTVVVERKTNGLAVTALVLSLLGLGLFSILFGHIALRVIRSNGDSGTAFAVAGLVIGYVQVIAVTIGLIIIGSGIIWAVNA